MRAQWPMSTASRRWRWSRETMVDWSLIKNGSIITPRQSGRGALMSALDVIGYIESVAFGLAIDVEKARRGFHWRSHV